MNQMQLKMFLQMARQTHNPHIIRLCEAIEEYLELFASRDPQADPNMYSQQLQASYASAWASLHSAADALGINVHGLSDKLIHAEYISAEEKHGIQQSLESSEKQASSARSNTKKMRNRKKNVRV